MVVNKNYGEIAYQLKRAKLVLYSVPQKKTMFDMLLLVVCQTYIKNCLTLVSQKH